jgi:hypothetical protein
MKRACLLAVALLALPSTAGATVLDGPRWPLAHTPLTLAPAACAADASCTEYFRAQAAAQAGESAEQRAARESRLLRLPRSATRDRAIDAGLRAAFPVRYLSDSPAARRRLRSALAPAALRSALARRLAARGWSGRDLGDLLAFQFLACWRMADGSARIDGRSATAFRDGLRDLVARDVATAPLTPAELEEYDQGPALYLIGVERIAATLPARERRALRPLLKTVARRTVQTDFGIDPLRLRPVPTGFARR